MKAALAFALGAAAQAKDFPIDTRAGPLACAGSFEFRENHDYGGNVSVTGNFSVSADHEQELHFGEGRCSGKAVSEFSMMVENSDPYGPTGGGAESMNLRVMDVVQDNWGTQYLFAKIQPPQPYGPPSCDMHDQPVPCLLPSQYDSMLPSYSETVDRGGSQYDVFEKEGGDEYAGGSVRLFFEADTSVLAHMEISSHNPGGTSQMTVDFSTFDAESAIPDSAWTIPLDNLVCSPGQRHGPYAPMLNAVEWPKDLHAARTPPGRLFQLLRAAATAAEQTSRATRPSASEALVEEGVDAQGSRSHVLAASVLVLPVAVLAAVVAGLRRRRRSDAGVPLLA